MGRARLIVAAVMASALLAGVVEARVLDAAARALCASDLLPTGGQAWEFSPRVPDAIGAALAAEAHLRLHQIGLDPEGLSRALDWLALGMTFFRVGRGASDRHDYACIP
ncbi:MAG: hypothetical protein HYV61_03340, partial [Candidatus Rokubacteria bacterium]|nr:hypothetical protein [Candidatus Rokubacteria bacterium]